jgi:hypothetical protein
VAAAVLSIIVDARRANRGVAFSVTHDGDHRRIIAECRGSQHVGRCAVRCPTEREDWRTGRTAGIHLIKRFLNTLEHIDVAVARLKTNGNTDVCGIVRGFHAGGASATRRSGE